jgi:hypothetical protein
MLTLAVLVGTTFVAFAILAETAPVLDYMADDL